jgi:Sulfite exporter TauE/SafE
VHDDLEATDVSYDCFQRYCRRALHTIIVTVEFVIVIAIGFLAQIVDGTLGMAFGVISTSAMLSIGLAPAQAIALVHTAEIFTTGASAASHMYHRNVDWRLVARLGIAGIIGAVLGAWILSNVDSGVVRPYIAAYLVLVDPEQDEDADCRMPAAATTLPSKRTNEPSTEEMSGCCIPVKMARPHPHRPS